MSAALLFSRIDDIPGVRAGHWTSAEGATGVSVVIFDKLSTASVHVAGGAPGSQETDLLDPSCLVPGVNAIVLSGGSAFGLACASGVRRYLEERGIGFNAGGHIVPIVPAAVIFDLATGAARPGPDEGYAACADAENPSGKEGAVGAGAGARVAKYLGMDKSLPGGVASRSVMTKDGIWVGAMMVVNCYGAVADPSTGKTIAAPRGDDGAPAGYLDAAPPPAPFGATSIGVVVTDARLTKGEAKRAAIMAHDGLARTIIPSHTPYDGDMIFAVSVGEKKGDAAMTGAWAARLVEECVIAAAGGR